VSRAPVIGGALSLSLLLVGSCTGTEVGNPVADIRVSLTARSSDAELVIGGGGGDAGTTDASATLTIDELWVSLGDVRFVLDEDCTAQRDLRGLLEGPFIADLAHAPSPLATDLPRGRYCSVRVSFERAAANDAGAPDGLQDHTVLIRGHRADGVPFSIRTRNKPDFVLHGQNEAFRADEAGDALFLAFDAGAWLNGVDLASATPNADGEVVIEPGGEMALLTTFETNLRRSLALFKDGNADGMLADDETETPLAE
jgi:hypothetical protein